MPLPDIINGQRDMSAGELDAELKRADDLQIQRGGGRQMRDWHLTASRTAQQRPGRTARYVHSGRVDKVRIAAGVIYEICFSTNLVEIRNSAGAVVASAAGMHWTDATAHLVVWDQVKIDVDTVDVVITFDAQAPLTARHTISTGAWVIAFFTFAIGSDGIPLVPYYRVAQPGATMQISAHGPAGTPVNVAFSAAVLKTGHANALFQWGGRRLRLLTVLSAVAGTGVLLEQSLPTQVLNLAAPDGSALVGTLGFSLGEIVEGSTSGTQGEVVGINSGTNQITVQVLNYASGFLASAAGPPAVEELIIGPHGRAKCTVVTSVGPAACVSWSEQVISDARGWPRSCSADQQRLIFCDLPALPAGVIWSATNQPYNMAVGANPTDGMVEIVAGAPRVYHVMPWTDEIVFTDSGIFYVPINQTNPLKPGSVSFPRVSPEPCSQIRPASTAEGYLFCTAGTLGISVLIGSGAAFSAQPYRTQEISSFHSHLFAGLPKRIAIAIRGGTVPERHVYVVNEDGTMVVGQYEASKQWIGWMPWSGTVNWVSTFMDTVTFVAAYQGVYVVEDQDSGSYLDGSMFINAIPTALTPPAGYGPFWWRPSGTVQLMDGLMPMGSRDVNHLGIVQPAYPGEDLTSATLRAGTLFVPSFEPFVPTAAPGQDSEQRQHRRGGIVLVVTVKDCAGLVLAKLYAGPVRANQPAVGSIVQERRIPAWMPGDIPTQAPPLRETTYKQRFVGRDYDPRLLVYKDVPGPIKLIEVGVKGSV